MFILSETESKTAPFAKNEPEDKVWWLYDEEKYGKGAFLFSFDKKKVYNLFEDYPHNLTTNEVLVFDNENEYWRDFFVDRT